MFARSFTSNRRVRRIVCFTPYDPRDPEPSAGTVFLQRWLVALARRFAVTVVTSDRSVVRPTSPNTYEGIAILVADPDPRRSAIGRVRDGLGPSRAFRDQAISGTFRALIDEADLLEAHWPGMTGLLPTLRRVSARPIVYVTYDIRTEALLSLARVTPVGRYNAVAAAKLARVALQEYRAIRSTNLVLCFRESERQAIRRWCGIPAEVLEPVFALPSSRPQSATRTTTDTGYRLGFIADMRRVENRVSISWFLAAIWPSISRALGNRLELHIFGRHRIADHTDSHVNPRVTWHGWVSDLSAAYDSIDVAIAPLRIKGGIKFKVAEALAHGVPVVASPIAVQGYPARIRRVVHTAEDAGQWQAALQTLDPISLSAQRRAPIELQEAVADSFDFDNMADAHLRRYARLIEIGRL